MVVREEPTTSSARSTCSSPSTQWLRGQVSDISDEDLSNFFDWHVYALPFAYKLYVEPREQNHEEYFGLDGEYTEEINYLHSQAQDFWSESGVEDDIEILCAHGSDLADRHEKLVPTLNVLFGGSYTEEYTVFDHATDVHDLIARLPGGYSSPLLTFNAFATDQVDEGDAPSSIIIGDGYFEFQDSIGMVSEGPEYALTHEHAHHLQFTLGVPQEEDDASQDARRQELLADALSAYFLAHNSGGDMDADEIENVHTIAYSVGDCEVTKDGHHGTPVQRRCATRWGATLADSQDDEGLDLIELQDRFDAWYERIDGMDDDCEYAISAASFASYQAVRYGLQAVAILVGSAILF